MSKLQPVRVQLVDSETGTPVTDVELLSTAEWIQYSNPTQTIRDFRGIKRGTSFENEPLQNIIDAVLYPYIEPTLKYVYGNTPDIQDHISDNKLVYVENFTKVPQFTFYANIEVGSESSLSCLFKRFECTGEVKSVQTTVVVQPGSTYLASFDVEDITQDTHIQIVVSDGKSMAESPIISFKFINPIYVGFCNNSIIDTRTKVIDYKKATAYFNTLIKNKSPYLEKRVCNISNQKGIILDDAKYIGTALYPVILYPNNWVRPVSITDANCDDVTGAFAFSNDLLIKISETTSTASPYSCYMSTNPYNVQLQAVKNISYNFVENGVSLARDGKGVPSLTGFDVLCSVPVDLRTVVYEYAELEGIAHPYNGLVTYVQEQKAFFKYEDGAWIPTNQQIFVVNGVPSEELGSINDISIDISTGSFYQKTDSNSWESKGVISGSGGISGYGPEKVYNKDDVVSYNGKLYIAIKDNICGVEPGTDDSAWMNASSAQGTPGKAATITIVDTVTGEPDSVAKVENIGDETNARLLFTIPRGETGPQGPRGEQGPAGPQGPSGIVKIGTVLPGKTFTVTNSGTDSEAILNFTYPESVDNGSVKDIDGTPIHLVLRTTETVGE